MADRLNDALRHWGPRQPLRLLLDLRRFNGLIDFDDVVYIARRRGFYTRTDVPGRIAMVAHNAFDRARTATFASLFPADTLNSFDAIDPALDWLSGA